VGGPVLQLFFGVSPVFLRSFTEEIPKKYRRNTEEMGLLGASQEGGGGNFFWQFRKKFVSLHFVK
jgi:hypothetical protein